MAQPSLSPGSAAGQSRSYDSGTGLYTVTYYSYDLEQDTSVQFEALNKVGPVVLLDSIAVEAPGQFLYVYRVLNDSSVAGTTQRIANIEAPCEGTSGISWPTGWLGWSGDESELVGGGSFCAYTTDVGIARGTELSGFGVAAGRSPGIATWYVRAPRPPLNWPDVGEHQEAVHDLIEEITGGGGPWATAYAPSPTYALEEVDIGLLQTQFTTVCNDPLWLDDSQLCTEFGDLLDLAEDEAEDDNFHGAAAVLGRLHERVLDERASMHPNAFWLLSLNAAQAESNALDSPSAVADHWPVLTASRRVLSGGWELSDTTQRQGANTTGRARHLKQRSRSTRLPIRPVLVWSSRERGTGVMPWGSPFM